MSPLGERTFEEPLGSGGTPGSLDFARTKLLGCATVIEEMLPFLPADLAYEVFDFGLHLRPHRLQEALQEAIDAATVDHDVILLGYGLCSLAVVGLRATDCTLVIPRVDDCIGAFLGGQEAYQTQTRNEPGTYYLTKGWIEVSDTLLDEYERIVDRYGEERANRLMGVMLRNYRRLVYIDTGHADQDTYRDYARKLAERFGLAFEEIAGSPGLIRKLVYGPWDQDIVVVHPGHTVTYENFRAAGGSNTTVEVALVSRSPAGSTDD